MSSCLLAQALRLRHSEELNKIEQLLVQCEAQRADQVAQLEAKIQYMQLQYRNDADVIQSLKQEIEENKVRVSACRLVLCWQIAATF